MLEKMGKREWVIWILLGILMVGMVYILTNRFTEQSGDGNSRIAYVDVVEVFDAFEMQKELAIKLDGELNVERSNLDSLKFQLQSLGNQLNQSAQPSDEEIQQYQILESYYFQEYEAFENYQLELTSKYDDQILSQMSQYIKDYGFNNGYDFIFGATGDGNILYGATPKDVTQDVIQFINASYQGKN